MNPLVTVICLCYNHEPYAEEALQSVFSQTYSQIQVIVVDDASKDKSREVLERSIAGRSNTLFIKNETNLGNCISFNKALALAKGKYIIDFATDDVMLPDRIEKQVNSFEQLGETFGVIFTNAVIIDERGEKLGMHYPLQAKVEDGEVYTTLLSRYFISPPTMMIRKRVLEDLGGYDESLAYEDFDFWVRSSRKYKYFYLNELLTKRRILTGSHSTKFNKKGFDKMTESTYRVVEKAVWLNKSEEENKALAPRIYYEMKHAFYLEQFEVVRKYFGLLKDMEKVNRLSKALYFLSRINFPLYRFYKMIRGPL